MFLGGTYSVSSNNPCSASDIIFIDECDQTINGIEDHEISSSIMVYPNPTIDEVFIEFDTAVSDILSLEVFDSSGRLVHIEKINAMNGHNLVKFQVDELSAGEYIGKIKGTTSDWNKQFVFSKE